MKPHNDFTFLLIDGTELISAWGTLKTSNKGNRDSKIIAIREFYIEILIISYE